jgi:superfamily I DNA and/or RNA helicase
MRLTAGEEDSQTGGDTKPVTAEVLEKMFGDKNFKITENYREAMNIAINTPDLALIQGPPGTGKTTLIKGIVARLNSMGNKNYKILVSSEQHEALFNVVEKLSANKLIPPFISSKKHNDDIDDNEDSDRFKSNVENFQREFIGHCDELLKDKINGASDFSSALSDIIYSIKKIRADNYSLGSINENLPVINDIIVKKDFGNAPKEIIKKISEVANSRNMNNSLSLAPGKQWLINKIEAQRITIESYLDDGPYQLSELQRLLKKDADLSGHEIDDDLLKRMQSGNKDIILSAFTDYKKYVEDIRNNLLPKRMNEFEKENISFRELFDRLMAAIQDYSKSREKDFYDIVEELKYKLLDTDNIVAAVKRYTNIIGSTCAQAKRSIDKTELSSSARYDYVIIDEAARANPLDIMIPVMLGTRVILVGDQAQLPHFIETKEAREFSENKEQQQYGYDGKLLEKSLFGLIYERVEKSWNEKKLKFKRHIRINEQHRMHPVIGDFISREFYNGDIKNGISTANNINEYNIFNGKNVVWQNVPITSGLEEGKPSYFRVVEAKKTISILSEIVTKLKGKEPKIGIISFYKKQIDIINKDLEEFPQDILSLIECNTVDSFQGKEFDIVILSTVRSNAFQTAGESLGFIHYSKSRINVALSRAKRLLIIVGDERTLGRNDIFAGYIKYVKEVGYYG